MKNDGERRSIYENPTVLCILVFGVLLIVYGFPQGLLTRYYGIDLSVDKLLFSVLVIGLFVINKIKTMKITGAQILFIVLAICFAIASRDPRCILLCYLPAIEDLLPHRNRIIHLLRKSSILYICVFLTAFYTIIYLGINIVNADRFAFSAIAEINQSGLAIFMLAILLMIKNKKIGYAVMTFGLLTVSRSYFVAVALYLFGRTKFIRNVFRRIKHWWFFNYWVLVILSSILLIGLGVFYIQQNELGNVYWGDDVETRLFNLLDYSNMFRFVTNITLLLIFFRHPIYLMTGLDDQVYFSESAISYSEVGIPFKALNPHNLFFSHLRLYGVFALIETWYIARIFKREVNSRNLMIFLIAVLYSIILGAGLYSYWIYLTFFGMCVEGYINKRD